MADKKPPERSPKARSLKERQREARTALILGAAYDLLIEKGYYETSIDQIAARVGISKGTVYLHFDTKDDLMIALIEQQIAQFLALIDQVINEKATVRERIEHILLHTYTGIQGERRVLLDLMNTVGVTRAVLEKRPQNQARFAEVRQHIAALFEEGKRTGELNPDIPTAVMVAAFVSLMSLYGQEALTTGGALPPDQLAGAVGALLFRGVLARP